MSTWTDLNQQSALTTDGEHRVQLELLQALLHAVRDGAPPADIGDVLDQLSAYSEAHFMSEELLMRLNSYDGLDDHVGDHIHMMDTLADMQSALAAGNSALVPGKVEEARAFIAQHIATRDRRFEDFMREAKSA